MPFVCVLYTPPLFQRLLSCIDFEEIFFYGLYRHKIIRIEPIQISTNQCTRVYTHTYLMVIENANSSSCEATFLITNQMNIYLLFAMQYIYMCV